MTHFCCGKCDEYVNGCPWPCQWERNKQYESEEVNDSKCSSCNAGTMKETSLYDDWEGMLTCDKCGVRVKN